MTYYLYIIECVDKKLYTGTTNNLARRIKIHNEGKGPDFTRKRLPIKLVYIEKFNNLKSARRREKQIKGWRSEKKLNLIKYDHPLPEKIKKIIIYHKTK